MLIVTTESIAGKELEMLGLVKGSTIQSKHLGSDISQSFKTLVGGELKSYTEMMNDARALATKPEVLFLDENMAGLNPAETEEAIQLIRKINESGVTILLIEHIMKAVVSLCEKVIVLHHGEKIAEGTPEQVMNDPYVMEVYLGTKKEGASA